MSIQTKDLVQSADNMDNATFQKHMNNRHRNSLGGLEFVDLSNSEMASLWRIFHRKLHQLRVDIPHEHGPYRPKSRQNGDKV